MTIYYVDYAVGSDTNAGTSAATAWKHAPGDATATANVTKVHLVGGDKVLFKAGVVYEGAISIPASGTSGKPIVYEGTGWGTGQAILSGQTTVQATFTPYAGNPKLSVATLPAAEIPNQYSVVDIDGRQAFMSNTSTSTNPYFIDKAGTFTPNAVTYAVSEMTGSGTSWTLTNSTLAAQLRSLDPSTINSMVLVAYGANNANYNLAVTGFNSTTGAVSLSGAFNPYSTGSYTLLNNPKFLSSSNPYPEYAAEGSQIIAAVGPGVHAVSVSTHDVGIAVGEHSNVAIDGFDMTGYGPVQGDAINATTYTEQNVTITNNTVTNLGSANRLPADLLVQNFTNVTISGNNIANLLRGVGIGITYCNNATVTKNTIDQPGTTGIDVYGNVNSTVSYNRISNALDIHADGIAVYDINGHRNQNVSITNNQINNVVNGITFEGQAINAAQPNNLTFAYNVVTNVVTHGWGIADWGFTNGAKVFGNIVTTAPDAWGTLSVKTNSTNISYYNNILQQFPWLSNTNSMPAHTFSNNVALTAGNVPVGVNNTVNTGLVSVLSQILAQGKGTMPSSIGAVLSPTGPATIGIDFLTGKV